MSNHNCRADLQYVIRVSDCRRSYLGEYGVRGALKAFHGQLGDRSYIRALDVVPRGQTGSRGGSGSLLTDLGAITVHTCRRSRTALITVISMGQLPLPSLLAIAAGSFGGDACSDPLH